MPRIARFWDALPRFGQPPSCKQPGVCSENSGLRQAISELVQRSGKALRHGLEPRLESRDSYPETGFEEKSIQPRKLVVK